MNYKQKLGPASKINSVRVDLETLIGSSYISMSLGMGSLMYLVLHVSEIFIVFFNSGLLDMVGIFQLYLLLVSFDEV